MQSNYSHCTGTVQSQGKKVRNVKQVNFKPEPEDCYERCGSDRSDRLFQTRTAVTEKDRSPTLGSRVWLTINDEDELERSR